MVKGEPAIYKNLRYYSPKDKKSKDNPVTRTANEYQKLFQEKKRKADQNVERARGPITPEKKREEEELADQFEQWLLNIFTMGLSAATKNKVVGYAISSGYRNYKDIDSRRRYQGSSGSRNYGNQGKTVNYRGNSRKTTSSNGNRKPYEQR